MVVKAGSRITFIFSPSTPIKQACLVGDFNKWKLSADVMQQMPDGSFRKTKKLAPGHYEYKFYADGIYWNDPEAESQTINPYGTLNSVVTILAK
jgi:1,4-alpha-glucan branching enzyme